MIRWFDSTVPIHPFDVFMIRSFHQFKWHRTVILYKPLVVFYTGCITICQYHMILRTIWALQFFFPNIGVHNHFSNWPAESEAFVWFSSFDDISQDTNLFASKNYTRISSCFTNLSSTTVYQEDIVARDLNKSTSTNKTSRADLLKAITDQFLHPLPGGQLPLIPHEMTFMMVWNRTYTTERTMPLFLRISQTLLGLVP